MSGLPASWVEIEIGQIADVVSGGTPSASEPENFSIPGEGIAWLTPADLSGYKLKDISHGARDLSQRGYDSCSAKLMPKGSLLFSSRAPIGYVAIAANEISTNQGFKSFVFSDEVNPSYAFYYLKSIRQLAESLGTGTTFKELSSAAAKTLPLRLPPLAEQTRIAEKLDELLAQVDTLKARIDALPALLKRFRQSVLAAAVSGRLTEEWRDSPNLGLDLDSLPNASKTRRGVPENVKLPEVLETLQVPKNWTLASAAKLLKKGLFIDLKDGNHGANHPKTSEFSPEGLPFITAANVSSNGVIDYLNAPKVSGIALEKLRVGFSEPGDVIFTHKGTVGRVALNSKNCVLTPQTTYYRLNQKFILSKYLLIFLKSNIFQIQTNEIKSQTTRDFIPITAQYELFHLLPPVLEQTEIVRRVEQLFAFADQLEAKVAAAKTRIDHLTQSILAKAFRGELVPQDPNDEPASVLLERIKAQRAAAPKAKRRRNVSA